MTQVYAEDGQAISAHRHRGGPCVVVAAQVQGEGRLLPVQMGLVERRAVKRVTKAMKGTSARRAFPLPGSREFPWRRRPRSRSETRSR